MREGGMVSPLLRRAPVGVPRPPPPTCTPRMDGAARPLPLARPARRKGETKEMGRATPAPPLAHGAVRVSCSLPVSTLRGTDVCRAAPPTPPSTTLTATLLLRECFPGALSRESRTPLAVAKEDEDGCSVPPPTTSAPAPDALPVPRGERPYEYTSVKSASFVKFELRRVAPSRSSTAAVGGTGGRLAPPA